MTTQRLGARGLGWLAYAAVAPACALGVGTNTDQDTGAVPRDNGTVSVDASGADRVTTGQDARATDTRGALDAVATPAATRVAVVADPRTGQPVVAWVDGSPGVVYVQRFDGSAWV